MPKGHVTVRTESTVRFRNEAVSLQNEAVRIQNEAVNFRNAAVKRAFAPWPPEKRSMKKTKRPMTESILAHEEIKTLHDQRKVPHVFRRGKPVCDIIRA